MKTALIVLTCNAARWLPTFLSAVTAQTLTPDEVLFIDSSSTDGSDKLIQQAGFRVHTISRREFNHGGTRQLATTLVAADIYIFMTQDALLADDQALNALCQVFRADERVGVAYGRQLPHIDAGPLGSHARLFNYPEPSETRSLKDAARLGVKTCFNSDSFSAYRRSALEAVGGFPDHVIGTEDAYVAGRMLLRGWNVHYAADARVRHSHDYTLLQQFRRYFDIGVFYGREIWIGEHFGQAGGEGRRFVLSELRYLLREGKAWLLPYALLQNVAKYAGYRLGQRERQLSPDFKRRISMNPNFWNQDEHSAR